ncbi:MAG: GGDEF domain-containing protein [Spirochaetaceae bacterium]|nr:GGDEF domain-containing protein [Spirochaetaceae bacterium]
MRHLKKIFSPLLNKWIHLGFSKKQISLCRESINAHNAAGLVLLSIATAALIVALSLYNDTQMNDSGNYFLFAFIQIFILFYGISLKLKTVKKNWCYDIGILLFSTNIFCFSIYICIFHRGTYVMRFLLFFLSAEAVFVTSAAMNLIFNLGLIAVFCIAYNFSAFFFKVKMPYNSYHDILNLSMACLMMIMINWYSSHVFIKELISSIALKKERNRYREESIKDQLTGLNNRRSFEQSVSFYTSVCRQVHQTVCIMMMDIDFFKKYNDHYGHQKGDFVLKSVGQVLNKLAEEEKVYAARIGGEEFIILWTENRTIEAERVALKLRQMIIDLQIPHDPSPVADHVTVSLGLYIMRGGSTDTQEELYNAADSALYKAKDSSRNCIVCLDSKDHNYQFVELRDYTKIVTR